MRRLRGSFGPQRIDGIMIQYRAFQAATGGMQMLRFLSLVAVLFLAVRHPAHAAPLPSLETLVQRTGGASLPGARAALESSLPANTPAVAPSKPTVISVELDKAKIEFDDGDTISYDFTAAEGVVDSRGWPLSGEIRLLGFDTPETLHPQHGIFYDQPYGLQASALTRRVILAAKTIELRTSLALDRHGRLLAHILIDGKLLSIIHIEAGLAYETASLYPDDHKPYPDLAQKVLAAWASASPIQAAIKAGKAADFADPGAWRAENQDWSLRIPHADWRALSSDQQTAAGVRARRNCHIRGIVDSLLRD